MFAWYSCRVNGYFDKIDSQQIKSKYFGITIIGLFN
jgi:hypothetical protein